MKKVLGLTDIEDLLWLASELVWHLWMEAEFIDYEGNYLGFDEQRIKKSLKERYTNQQFFKFLNIKGCQELKKLSILDVEKLSVADIKARYLQDSLPMARKSFREDNILLSGLVAGESITDDYLDAIFCLAWKNDLKIWAIKWHENDNIDDETD